MACMRTLIDFASAQKLPLRPDGRRCLRHVLEQMGLPQTSEEPAPQYGCARCSELIPDPEPPVVCNCCQSIYCLRCFTQLTDFIWKHEREVNEALRANPDRDCLEVLFEAIDRFMLEELLNSIPVPSRGKGH